MNKNSNVTSTRVHYIDCLRVFACLLVVSVHCNFMPENPKDHIWAQILGVLGAPSSELFLAISGSLLIPVRTTQKYFYRRRFSKLLPPLLLWSIVGIVFYVLTGQRSPSEIGYMLFSLPFRSVIIPPFWFMYSIIGMYLIAPILTPYLNQNGRSGVLFLLALWVISLILPLGNLIFDGFYSAEGNYKYLLSSFSGYTGYMLLGYYLRKYPLKITEKRFGWMSLMLGLLLMLMIIAIVGFRWPQHREYVLGNLSLVNAIIVALYFSLFQAMFTEGLITKLAQKLTKYTFGVYLIHIFVIEFVNKIFLPLHLPVPVLLVLIPLFSIILCFVIVWILSMSSITKWSVQGIDYSKPLEASSQEKGV